MVSDRWTNYKNSIITGGSKNSGFVRKLEAQNKIILEKVKNASLYLQKKYGNKNVEILPTVQEEAPTPKVTPKRIIQKKSSTVIIPGSHHEDQPYERAPEKEIEYDDYNVGNNKKKVNKKDKSKHTEVEEENLQRVIDAEIEERRKTIEKLDKLKLMFVDYKDKFGRLETKYLKDLKELQSLKNVRKAQKSDMVEARVVKNHSDIKQLKVKYKDLFDYMKENKLVDINMVYKNLMEKRSKNMK
jgi:hypothetical protein